MTIGTTDMSKQFHPFGLGITLEETSKDFEFLFKSVSETSKKTDDFDYKPTVLIADNAPAITNGFVNAYINISKRVCCWAHVIRNIDIYLKPIKNEQSKIQIRYDICKIQLSINEGLFKKALELFFIKWRGDIQINNFLDYFENQWCLQNDGWYEGYSWGIPSHSNAIESTHKQMKAFELLRNRLAFNQFLNSMQTGLVYEWSMERNPTNNNCKLYHSKPIITTKDWTDAFKWNSKNHKCVKLDNVYFVSETKSMISKEDCRSFIETFNSKPWKTFDEMMASRTACGK